MNCPSRPDTGALEHDGWNQSPPPLALDTNNDANGIANLRQQRDHRIRSELPQESGMVEPGGEEIERQGPGPAARRRSAKNTNTIELEPVRSQQTEDGGLDGGATSGFSPSRPDYPKGRRVFDGLRNARQMLSKYVRFIGPGFMVAVAYIDPGNYATDVAAGASYKFRLLVMVLVSNIIAIFLQSLCIRLGSVSGLNLAENIHAHCPKWLNYALYFVGEAAIIATDIAEVIGTAIALKLLLNVPLVAGCAISIVDVLIILIFYRPSGSVRGLRLFEVFVMLLVFGVVICFCIELSMIYVPDVGEVFKGYLPSDALVEAKGLYQACGILGATVMPHSLYLGSGIVQPRLREYDEAHGNIPSTSSASSGISTSALPPNESSKYRPTIAAIRFCLNMSIIELAVSLFTFALFVNSSILIVAGASLSDTPKAEDADLFSIHRLLSNTLAPVAGTLFALALLLSGTSAGIVCTIAGQMVSEGQLRWSVRPWIRRLITRSISITPSIIIAGAVGQRGLSTALEASQVALSVALPFTSAPLIYFTCRNRYMTVHAPGAESRRATAAQAGARDGTPETDADADADDAAVAAAEQGTPPPSAVKMRNNRIVAVVAAAFWLLIVVMNCALLVLAAMGKQ